MKIIGKAPGKAPKAWCLMQNSKTGHYYVGYDGEWPLHGSYDAVLKKVAEAKADLAKKGPRPTVLPEVARPAWISHKTDIKTLPQEDQDHRAAFAAYNASEYAANQWDKLEEETLIVPLDYVPVFEDELRFVGYTRGRSSVTMVFEASNGQRIEFGPSGIDGLIQGIIDGQAAPQAISGTYEREIWNPEKHAHDYETTPRGRGIKARFKFAKKGANTYAELVEPV